MTHDRIDVIATTVSGSVADWKKVDRILPSFQQHGLSNVRLHVVDSHAEARRKACECLVEGGRIPISAGGSGTFKNVLEGCIDSAVPLDEIRLGFLRKGSADLIGKVLGMPDDIDDAARVFAESLAEDRMVPCDVLSAESLGEGSSVQHFVGYGGVELFGRIPHFTENRMMKWYKGLLGQLFGDLGPFTTGMSLALVERIARGLLDRRRSWRVVADGERVLEGKFQALLFLNGYLGPELAFSDDPLGSGRFHLFGIRDQGTWRLLGQVGRARNGNIVEDPQAWGFESVTVTNTLDLHPDLPGPFPANVDGSTLQCTTGLRVSRCDRLRLIAAAKIA